MELQIRYLGKSEKLSTRILLEGSSGNIGGIIGELQGTFGQTTEDPIKVDQSPLI